MRRVSLIFSLIILVILISGCGSNALTEEENELIAEYAANEVLQNNPGYDSKLIKEESGDASADAEMISADATTEETATTEAEGSEATTEAATTEAAADDSNSSNGGTESDSSNGTSGSGTSGTSSNLSGTTKISKDLSSPFKSLGLTVKVKGYDLAGSYSDGNSSSSAVTPINGGQLLIARLKITNSTSKDITFDMLDYNYKYSLTTSSGTTYSLMTVLEDDFSVYQGTIKSKESADVVLLFEIPQGLSKPLTDATISVSNGSDVTSVALQ